MTIETTNEISLLILHNLPKTDSIIHPNNTPINIKNNFIHIQSPPWNPSLIHLHPLNLSSSKSLYHSSMESNKLVTNIVPWYLTTLKHHCVPCDPNEPTTSNWNNNPNFDYVMMKPPMQVLLNIGHPHINTNKPLDSPSKLTSEDAMNNTLWSLPTYWTSLIHHHTSITQNLSTVEFQPKR